MSLTARISFLKQFLVANLWPTLNGILSVAITIMAFQLCKKAPARGCITCIHSKGVEFLEEGGFVLTRARSVRCQICLKGKEYSAWEGRNNA